jgi:YVTN family beta-propeller protein
MSRNLSVIQIGFLRNACALAVQLMAVLFLIGRPALAAGPKAYVGNFKDNTISVIDVNLKRITATIPVPPGPHGIAITPDNRWVYVASDGASSVSVIDTATDKLVETIEVGRNPHGVIASADGKYVLVGVYDTDTVVIIDTLVASGPRASSSK